jgi:hypothetical protein
MSVYSQQAIFIAAEDRDYNVSLQSFASGDAYKTFKDTKLLYNPVTGILKVNAIQFPNTDQTSNGLPKSEQTYLNTATSQSVAAGTVTDLVGLQASIKPSSQTSKILVVVRWFGELSNANSIWNSMFGIKRNGSPIGNPVNPGSRNPGMASNSGTYNHGGDANSTPEVVQYYYIDSPGTNSPVTYQATIFCKDALTLFTNRTVADTDTAAGFERGTSNIFLMEVL